MFMFSFLLYWLMTTFWFTRFSFCLTILLSLLDCYLPSRVPTPACPFGLRLCLVTNFNKANFRTMDSAQLPSLQNTSPSQNSAELARLQVTMDYQAQALQAFQAQLATLQNAMSGNPSPAVSGSVPIVTLSLPLSRTSLTAPWRIVRVFFNSAGFTSISSRLFLLLNIGNARSFFRC